MKVWDDSGEEVDATFSVEEWKGGKSVVFHSRGGKRGAPGTTNVNYNLGMDLVLQRLGRLGFSLTDALLDSAPVKKKRLPEAKRRLVGPSLRYPLRLKQQDSFSLLGNAIRAAQGNNRTRRIRIILAEDETSERGTALSLEELELFLAKGALPSDEQSGEDEVQLRPVAEDLAATGAFDAVNEEDARRKTLRAIAVRQGQPRFRRELLKAYEGRCAISGCDVKQALEAAHIVPYRGAHTDHVQNGLLLRADLHSLFDLGLFTIDPETWTIVISPRLRGTMYESLGGQRVRLPASKASRPLSDALLHHRERAGLG